MNFRHHERRSALGLIVAVAVLSSCAATPTPTPTPTSAPPTTLAPTPQPTTAPTASLPTRTATPPTAGFFKWPCGTVAAYVAPSASAAGSIALGTANFVLAAGSGPTTGAAPSVGSSLCVNGEQNAQGVFTQFSNSPMGEGICSTVLAYTPASGATPGTLDFGTPKPPVRIPIASGVTFTSAQVTGDQCFRVIPDAEGTAQVTAYRGPRQ